MEFRTVFKPRPSRLRLSPRRPLIFVGSCFAENICRRLQDMLWPAYNLTGALYNPESIIMVMRRILLSDKVEFPKESLLEHSGLWHCWMLDSKFSDVTPEGVERRFLEAASELRSIMESGADLIVTFGTAWVYRLTSPELLAGNPPFTVGNCHKVPSSAFTRERLSVEAIRKMWSEFYNELKARYPQTRLLFTLSPVRHIKDGFAGNSLSKATLRVAIEEIAEACGEDVEYFPAYEILLDDLRDYRFYASDMLHPSDMAVEYIQKQFLATYVDAADQELLKEGESIPRLARHRPINPTEENLRHHRQILEGKINSLKTVWPEALWNKILSCDKC